MSTPYTFSGFSVSNSISGITTDSSHIYIINSPTGSALKNVLLSAYAIENNFAYSATINANGFDLKNYAGTVLSTINLAGISVNYATTATYASYADNINDMNINWGGPNSAGQVKPIDVAINNEFNPNRLAFMRASDIKVQYSTDNGTTWIDYSATDNDKRSLVTTKTNFYIGKKTSGITINDKIRITLTAADGYLYFSLRKTHIYLSTNGAQGCYVNVETKNIANYNTYGDSDTQGWTTHTSNQSVGGWSGWNSLQTNFTFGGSSTQTYQVRQVRFTFGISGLDSSHTNCLDIISIRQYGENCWSATSTYQQTGHIYSFDIDQNVYFPSYVRGQIFQEQWSQENLTPTSVYYEYNSDHYIRKMSWSDFASRIRNYTVPILNGGTGLTSTSVNAILVGTATNSANWSDYTLSAEILCNNIALTGTGNSTYAPSEAAVIAYVSNATAATANAAKKIVNDAGTLYYTYTDISNISTAAGNAYSLASGKLSPDGNLTGTWQGNSPSSFAAAGHTHAYLPLAGGTTTGDVQFNKRIIAYSYTTSNAGPFITFDKNGSHAAGIGPDGTEMTIQFGTVDNYSSTAWSATQGDMIWNFRGTLEQNGYSVIHAGNISTQSVNYATSATKDSAGDSISGKYAALSGATFTGQINTTTISSGRSVFNVAHFTTSDTPVETIIYSKIKYISGTHMPVVRIYGYAYGLNCPIELKIGFYIYNGNLGWSGAVSMGAWRPTIKLFKYTGSDSIDYVAIALVGACYFLGFDVDVQAPCKGTLGTSILINGWTVIGYNQSYITTNGSQVGTTNLITVPYKSTLESLTFTGYQSKTYNGTGTISIEIPNNTNQLTNGAGFITSTGVTSNNFSGTLPISKGGTGLTSASANAILVGTATNSADWTNYKLRAEPFITSMGSAQNASSPITAGAVYDYMAAAKVTTTTTLVAGSNATVSVTNGTSGPEFTFGIPQGTKGDTGATGSSISSVTLSGTYTAASGAANYYKVNVGSTCVGVFSVQNGAVGATGQSISSVTISGTYTAASGAANYYKVNVGTTCVGVFSVQNGAKGDQGIQGLTGAQGPAGATGPQGPAGATGAKGDTGAQGIGISSVTFGATTADGGAHSIVFTKTDGTTCGTFYVYNGSKGSTGAQGPVGYYFTPSVATDGTLSWTNNGGLTNPTSVNIKGPTGATGAQGPAGATGPQGPAGATGAQGVSGYTFTPSINTTSYLIFTPAQQTDTPSTVNTGFGFKPEVIENTVCASNTINAITGAAVAAIFTYCSTTSTLTISF